MADKVNKKYILYGLLAVIAILVGVSIYQYSTTNNARKTARSLQEKSAEDSAKIEDLSEEVTGFELTKAIREKLKSQQLSEIGVKFYQQ